MATKSGTMSAPRHNQIQYYLQGSVPSSNLDSLIQRLKGLCEMAAESDSVFEDHEMVYNLKGGSSNVTFRVRRSILAPNALWQLCYLGSPEGGGDKTRQASMRTCVEVAASDNVSLFLEEIGFRFDHELVLKGYCFRKGNMKIKVSKIYRVLSRGDVNRIQPLTDSHLVEMTANSTVQQDTIAEEIKAFGEHLKPITVLERAEQR
ncbi:mediator of RNA polymerase II transcription subunit 18-like [Rhopilema esculentum]|uniref:mediator of RNA polymerase II transcription subunit 18-like n=1 Tax=Rhopilema esculentum TaxID=499914 RepID=UPI0031E48DEB